MMDRLPLLINPIRLADRRDSLVGQMDLSKLDRLADLLATNQGQIDIKLDLGIDKPAIRFMRGRIQADLKLVCQRCLQTMDHRLDTKVLLGIVRNSEQAENLPKRYDPLIVEDDEISFQDIIEDEMILAMPATPVHANDTCKSHVDLDSISMSASESNNDEEDASKRATKQENPFAILETLKQKR